MVSRLNSLLDLVFPRFSVYMIALILGVNRGVYLTVRQIFFELLNL